MGSDAVSRQTHLPPRPTRLAPQKPIDWWKWRWTASRRVVSQSGRSPWRRALSADQTVGADRTASADQTASAITYDAVLFRLYFDPAQDRLVLYANHCVLVAAGRDAEDTLAIESDAAAAVYPGSGPLQARTGLFSTTAYSRRHWSVAVRLSTKRRAGSLRKEPEKRTRLGATRRAAILGQALLPASASKVLVDLGRMRMCAKSSGSASTKKPRS